MKELRLSDYLKKAWREYEKTKRAVGEEQMRRWGLDYDFLLYWLLKQELEKHDVIRLVYKKRTYDIYTTDDLERTLLIIKY
jgi:hypothetical protein